MVKCLFGSFFVTQRSLAKQIVDAFVPYVDESTVAPIAQVSMFMSGRCGIFNEAFDICTGLCTFVGDIRTTRASTRGDARRRQSFLTSTMTLFV